jgi:hypothetical protein
MDKNVLYYGDCLDVLRWHIKDESLDLIYLNRLLTLTPAITCSLANRTEPERPAGQTCLRIHGDHAE